MEPYAVAHGDAVLGFTVISLDPRTVDRPFGRGGEAERQKQQEEKASFSWKGSGYPAKIAFLARFVNCCSFFPYSIVKCRP